MTEATIKVEGAKVSDLEEIYTLLRLVGLPIEGVKENIDYFLLLLRQVDTTEEIIGCVGLEIYEQYALLRSAVIHPDHQGKKYGKQLTLAIIAFAKLNGIAQLFLLTETAERFFEKFGFSKITRSQVPDIVKTSLEFTTLCDESATTMTLKL
ncbi:MAG: GNAT family N-acetyltransferase [Asgard group archaeon]|nr:GNAT family N-acetyltransferase [Asgard group archaeon]